MAYLCFSFNIYCYLFFSLIRGYGESIKKYIKNLKNMKLNINYVDAIGYSISFDSGIKFLTGDNEFKNLPNVEFVK